MYTLQKSIIDYDPFCGPEIQKVVPTTEPQQEILVSCLLGGEEANLAYNESISLQLNGRINFTFLNDALRMVTQRHEALRASFNADGTKMVIYENVDIPLKYSDLSDLSADEQKTVIEEYNKQESATAFDLLNGPLIKFGLFKINNNEALLHINTHHVICDGWSMGILLEDISALYNNADIPAMPLQFSDYAEEYASFVQSDDYNEIENYWVKKYKDNLPAFELPADFQRAAARSYSCKRYDHLLDDSVASQIKKVAAKNNSSFVNTLMSAFEVLVYKLTGQSDIVIGVPVADQAASDNFNLIGHCVNLLPLRSNPDGTLPFNAYLKQRKSERLNDYDHQRFTFGTLLKKINVPRNGSRIPLVPLSLNVDIGMDTNVLFKQIDYTIVYNERISESFEIFLNVTSSKDKYIFQWNYNTGLFKEETIKYWMDSFVDLLRQIGEKDDVLIDAYQLPDHGKKAVDTGVNCKQLPDKTVVEMFEDVAEKYSENTALEFKGESISYQQLNYLADIYAAMLTDKGVRQGDIIGVLLDRSSELIISLLAILKCGATYLPLDPAFPAERIKFMLDDADTKYTIINQKYAENFRTNSVQVIIEDLVIENYLPFSRSAAQARQEDLAYILYTSGSTGKPKGVMITQKNLLNFLISMKEMFSTDHTTRLLSVTTVSFDISGLEIFLPLISGSTLILADAETVKDGGLLTDCLLNKRINLMQATPSTYKLMIEAGWNEQLPVTILCGGEALPKDLAGKLCDRSESVYNMYGPTETTIWSTVAKVNSTDDVVSIGDPILNTYIYLVKDHRLVNRGEIGEICIGGAGVAVGYYNRPELTAEKFIDDPFSNSGKMYKTGDLGKYTSSGALICLGRIDQQAKIRGYRIELGEIEEQILNIQQIKDVAVVVKNAGEAEKLVAYIIKDDFDTTPVNKQQIISWRNILGDFLPAYMIPEEWIPIKEFPLTPNKKTDRKALINYQSETILNTELETYSNDDLIDVIKKIWAEELQMHDIDEEDDFFALGGHSMIAVRGMTKINKETGVKLPLSVLFENSTIKSLSKVINEKKSSQNGKVVIPIKKEGKKNPIFLVHAGGLNILMYKSLSHFLSDDQPLYGLQGLGLDGDLSHLQSIETIATRYLQEIFEHQSQGPYIIMGYSFGGIIAYEMVRQLLEQNKEVLMLGILDTYAKDHNRASGKLSGYFIKSKRQFSKALFFAKAFFKYPRATLKYQKYIFSQKIHNKTNTSEDDKVHDYSDEVIKAYDKAYNNYVMQPLTIEIDLFKVEKRIYYIDDPAYLGWKKFATGGVRVHSVPGDHRTFLLAPHNRTLAKILQETVNQRITNRLKIQ